MLYSNTPHTVHLTQSLVFGVKNVPIEPDNGFICINWRSPLRLLLLRLRSIVELKSRGINSIEKVSSRGNLRAWCEAGRDDKHKPPPIEVLGGPFSIVCLKELLQRKAERAHIRRRRRRRRCVPAIECTHFSSLRVRCSALSPLRNCETLYRTDPSPARTAKGVKSHRENGNLRLNETDQSQFKVFGRSLSLCVTPPPSTLLPCLGKEARELFSLAYLIVTTFRHIPENAFAL